MPGTSLHLPLRVQEGGADTHLLEEVTASLLLSTLPAFSSFLLQTSACSIELPAVMEGLCV